LWEIAEMARDRRRARRLGLADPFKLDEAHRRAKAVKAELVANGHFFQIPEVDELQSE
jgi:hypothetical protein